MSRIVVIAEINERFDLYNISRVRGGEIVGAQRAILVLSELFNEVFVAPFTGETFNCYGKENIIPVSLDDIPDVDVFFKNGNHLRKTDPLFEFAKKHKAKHIFACNWAFLPDACETGALDAMLLWSSQQIEIGVPCNVPLEYWPLYIPPSPEYERRRWSFIGRGNSIDPQSKLHIVISAFLKLPKDMQEQEVSILRGYNLLRTGEILTWNYDNHLAYLERITRLCNKIRNLSIYMDVSQHMYQRLLAESHVVINLATGHVSPAMKEAVLYGTQVIRSPSLNGTWQPYEDTITMPDAMESAPDEVIEEWLVCQMVNLKPLDKSIQEKYRQHHSLGNSVNEMRKILERYGAL